VRTHIENFSQYLGTECSCVSLAADAVSSSFLRQILDEWTEQGRLYDARGAYRVEAVVESSLPLSSTNL
jgi:hypothetical protein